MRRSTLIGTLLITFSVYSQKNWEEKFNGYVVTLDSVIVKGYLKYDIGIINRGVKINLHKKPNEKPQEFYTLELLGYVFRKDTFEILSNVHPRQADLIPFIKKDKPNKVEAIVVSRGKLILYKIPEKYYMQMIAPGTAPGTTPGMQISSFKYFVYGILDDHGEITYVESKDFVEKMKLIIGDAPDLLARIEKKELKFRDLGVVIKEYNRRFKE